MNTETIKRVALYLGRFLYVLAKVLVLAIGLAAFAVIMLLALVALFSSGGGSRKSEEMFHAYARAMGNE